MEVIVIIAATTRARARGEEVVDGQYYYQVGVVDSYETTPTPAAAQYEYYQQAPLALDNQVQVVAGSKQQQQEQQQQQQERIEREKLNYLALAKEAHSKFFVDQISQINSMFVWL